MTPDEINAMDDAAMDAACFAAMTGVDMNANCTGEMDCYANGSCWQCDKCSAYDDNGPFPHKPQPYRYSKDMNHAMLLVERAREWGYCYMMSGHRTGSRVSMLVQCRVNADSICISPCNSRQNLH